MKYLKITNKGEIDWRLISLLGGTTKRGNDSKIGNFGSGLKYTLAYLLRENLDFKIYSGKKLVRVKTESEIIRETKFDIICIDGHRTSITTEMGPDFEMWQVCREIWANAIDEGEHMKGITSKAGGTEGETSWYIQINPKLQEVLDNWHKYFIGEHEEPIFSNETCKIYAGNGTLKLYKNGILIHEEKETKGLFRYDLLNANINELREYKGSISWPVCIALASAGEKVCKYFLENITESYFEGSDRMDYDWYSQWSGAWKDTIGEAKIITEESIGNIQARGIDIKRENYLVVPKVVYKQLTKQFEGVGALMTIQKGMEFMEHYDPIVENRVTQALAVLDTCNYIMHPELTFKYGYFEDKTVEARVNMQTKVICISNNVLNKPVFDVVCTLVEENEHFVTGMQDCSRNFQQHWIDMYVKELLAKNEIEV